MASNVVSARAVPTLRGVTLQVKISGIAVLRARIWLAAQVMKFAALIAGCAIDLTIEGHGGIDGLDPNLND